jgi:hypothetical protein
MEKDRHFVTGKSKERGSLTSRTRDMRNREMLKCKIATWSFGDCGMEFHSFKDRDMECQDISSQKLPKSRNAEMRNCDMEFRRSRLGESRCLTIGIHDMRNREMSKCEM